MSLIYAYAAFLDTNSKRVIAGSNSTSAAPPMNIIFTPMATFDIHMLRSIAGRLSYVTPAWVDGPILDASLKLLSTDGTIEYAESTALSFFPELSTTLAVQQIGGEGVNCIQRFTIGMTALGTHVGTAVGGYFAFSLPIDFESDESEASDAVPHLSTPVYKVTDWDPLEIQEGLEILYGVGNIRVAQIDLWTFDIEFIGELAETSQDVLMNVSSEVLYPVGLSFVMAFDELLLEDVMDAPNRRVEALLQMNITLVSAPDTYVLLSLPVTLVASPGV